MTVRDLWFSLYKEWLTGTAVVSLTGFLPQAVASITTYGNVSQGGVFDALPSPTPQRKCRRLCPGAYREPTAIDKLLKTLDPESIRQDALSLRYWRPSWGDRDGAEHFPLSPHARLSSKGCRGRQQHHGESKFEMDLRWRLRTWAKQNCFSPFESPGAAAHRNPLYEELITYRRAVTKNPTRYVTGGCPCSSCRIP